MIAYKLGGAPERRSRVGSRAGQTAAQLRRARTTRARYRSLVLGLSGLTIATVIVASYLMLMSGVYRLNYQAHSLEATRAALAEESARLDDRIAQLESRDRLATLADKLGMRDPRQFAVATVPPLEVRTERPRGLAFLPIATNWLR